MLTLCQEQHFYSHFLSDSYSLIVVPRYVLLWYGTPILNDYFTYIVRIMVQ